MLVLYLVIKKKYIGPLKFIIEGYDNLATITTVDSSIDLISISTISSYEPLIIKLVMGVLKVDSLDFVNRKFIF